MSNKKKSSDLKLIEQIPDTTKYQNKKITKKSNWFNKNMAVCILILFVIIGIMIVFLIVRFL
ncbi:MAG: hypothetical protein K2I36_02730 [Ureaplasma sp.]|nr:hypothetical protein [Ureaplasma sp.]MDE7221668.1 hypothetical protein [Ureaplasma sp.]